MLSRLAREVDFYSENRPDRLQADFSQFRLAVTFNQLVLGSIPRGPTKLARLLPPRRPRSGRPVEPVTGATRINGDTGGVAVMTKLQLTHVDERVLEQLHRRKAPQVVDTIAANLGLTREAVVLSLARLQLADLAEAVPPPDPTAARSWRAKD